MSFSAAHESKAVRRTCQSCQARKARFRYGGAVRADRDHPLCFECYRSERERRRAQVLAEVVRPESLWSQLLDGAALTAREVAHRRQMLAHLQRQRLGRR